MDTDQDNGPKTGSEGIHDEEPKATEESDLEVNGSPEEKEIDLDNGVEGWTKLHYAIEHENFKLFKSLLESGECDANAFTTEERLSPLLYIVREAIGRWEPGDLRYIRLLASHGADINHRDCIGKTALHSCAQTKNDMALEIANLLISLGADPNANQMYPSADSHGDGCTCGGHVGALLNQVEAAIEGEARPAREKRMGEDCTPLHLAAEAENVDMIRTLLENGAKTDIWDTFYALPLHCAVNQGCADACKLLVGEENAREYLALKNGHGYTPLQLASLIAYPDIVRLLLDLGGEVDKVVEGEEARARECGLSPLMLVCTRTDYEDRRLEVAKMLIDAGANLNIIGEKQQTALALAIMNGHQPLAELLVDHNADLKALEDSDSQPLMIAATKGHAAMCRWLIEKCGCNVNTRTTDDEGYTAIIQAAGYSNPETIDVLASLGADIEATIHDGRRATHFAAFKGKLDCMRKLVELGADIHALDSAEWSPLHFAARYHHPDIVRELLQHGAKVGGRVTGGPTYRTADGEDIEVEDFTAADLAKTRRGGAECVEILLEAGDTLSDSTKDLTDDDLVEEKKSGKCVVM
jgi:ankyrin repeat protein